MQRDAADRNPNLLVTPDKYPPPVNWVTHLMMVAVFENMEKHYRCVCTAVGADVKHTPVIQKQTVRVLENQLNRLRHQRSQACSSSIITNAYEPVRAYEGVLGTRGGAGQCPRVVLSWAARDSARTVPTLGPSTALPPRAAPAPSSSLEIQSYQVPN